MREYKKYKKVTGEILEVRSDKGLTSLTFDICHLIFDLCHLTFDI